ncbi:hypothetical protein [Pseudomonas sediminis]|uniref:hypothetical protein n=1 Tax=Pseudomonas sediminis TaxID=1691904 RepID=UPI0031CC8D55
MKKFFAGALVVSGFFVGSAFAAETIVSGNTVGAGECELLAEPVVVTLSNNVHGAYNCTRNNNSITVATCHFAGSRKVGPERCAVIGVNKDGDPVYNDNSCSGTGPEDVFNVTNKGKAYVGSTTGGSIAASSLDDFCSDETVTAVLPE